EDGIRDPLVTGVQTCALPIYYASFDFKSPSQHERHGKTERNRRDKDRQNPLGRVIGGHDCRADLHDEPCNHCIAERDAIDLPLFQFTEEGVHLSPVAYIISAIATITSRTHWATRSSSAVQMML